MTLDTEGPRMTSSAVLVWQSGALSELAQTSIRDLEHDAPGDQ